MCSISINATVDAQFGILDSKKRTKLKKRLFLLADEAGIDESGALDDPSCHIRRMPSELRKIRKKTFGRHRLYYTGFHKQCSYNVFYLKANKKTGVDDDDSKTFQKKLRRALNDTEIFVLPDPTQKQTLSN